MAQSSPKLLWSITAASVLLSTAFTLMLPRSVAGHGDYLMRLIWGAPLVCALVATVGTVAARLRR